MKSRQKYESIPTAVAVEQPAWWQEVGMLVKFRLTMLVVITALLAYLICAGEEVNGMAIVILGLGGFFVTGAANALNQILEKDFDRLMTRTANRPLAADRMQVNSALLMAGLMFVLGVVLLALFNPLAALLGALSVVVYAFLYTPLKRITPWSVFVGAVPGALPMMIGVVALEGRITPLALILFAIQFFWQFPHFWSIGFLGFEEYSKAGYKLMPTEGGGVSRGLGMHAFIFSLFLLPLCGFTIYYADIALWSGILAVILSIGYSWYAWNFCQDFDRPSARKLMFSSFLHLPIVLLILYMGSF